MTILLYKDGKLIVDGEQPLEGVSLDNLAVILSGASDGDVIQYDATKGMWVNKSAPSSLPEVTASDKGKYLKVNESTGDPEWASGGSSGGGVLVIHETVSGTTHTLDKTWKQIADAVDSGGLPYAVFIDERSQNTIKHVSIVDSVAFGSGLYIVGFGENGYATADENGYPSYTE